MNRYLVVEYFEDDLMGCWVGDEKQVSKRLDMADCSPGDCKVYWINDKGEPVKVKFGDTIKINTKEEIPFYFAETEMVAGGEIVGHMAHTDY